MAKKAKRKRSSAQARRPKRVKAMAGPPPEPPQGNEIEAIEPPPARPKAALWSNLIDFSDPPVDEIEALEMVRLEVAAVLEMRRLERDIDQAGLPCDEREKALAYILSQKWARARNVRHYAELFVTRIHNRGLDTAPIYRVINQLDETDAGLDALDRLWPETEAVLCAQWHRLLDEPTSIGKPVRVDNAIEAAADAVQEVLYLAGNGEPVKLREAVQQADAAILAIQERFDRARLAQIRDDLSIQLWRWWWRSDGTATTRSTKSAPEANVAVGRLSTLRNELSRAARLAPLAPPIGDGGGNGGGDQGGVGTPRPKRSRFAWLAEAMMKVNREPHLSDAAIARAVGVSASTLCRCAEYRRAAVMARERHTPGTFADEVDDSHPNRPYSRQSREDEENDDRLDREIAQRNADRNVSVRKRR